MVGILILAVVSDRDFAHERVSVTSAPSSRDRVVGLLVKLLLSGHDWFLGLRHLDEIVLLKLIGIVLTARVSVMALVGGQDAPLVLNPYWGADGGRVLDLRGCPMLSLALSILVSPNLACALALNRKWLVLKVLNLLALDKGIFLGVVRFSGRIVPLRLPRVSFQAPLACALR